MQHPKQTIIYNKKLSEVGIIMINLSLNELKLIAKYRGIKDYTNKSEGDLIKYLVNQKQK